jgi:hypothetical protein
MHIELGYNKNVKKYDKFVDTSVSIFTMIMKHVRVGIKFVLSYSRNLIFIIIVLNIREFNKFRKQSMSMQ